MATTAFEVIIDTGDDKPVPAAACRRILKAIEELVGPVELVSVQTIDTGKRKRARRHEAVPRTGSGSARKHSSR